MKAEKLYLVGIAPGVFRSGQPALITGVQMITPEMGLPRPCFLIEYEDLAQDQVPASEIAAGTYEFKTLGQLINNGKNSI